MDSMSKLPVLPMDQPETSTNMAASTSHEPGPAQQAVFDTNELLRNIIAQLPLASIAIATGVCRTWRDAIKADRTIQQALWRVPLDIREIETKLDCLDMRIKDMPKDSFKTITEVNPCLDRICDQLLSGSADLVCVNYPKVIARMVFQPHPKRPVGGMVDMFITQPPVKVVMVAVYPSIDLFQPITGDDLDSIRPKPMKRIRRVEFRCDGGITMGKLADFIQLQLQRHGANNGARVSIPKGFKPSSDPMPSLKTGSGTRRWEVRNGGVRRQKKEHT